ncbi:discoidin domain-containing protein [Streptomyces sp. NBC_00047]|uniref:discoidin domain-containing protein n=1 Tax=Streptomyces sp. NBC_00047 TaxID=2975627 RepID=UPI002257D2BA|nr:discoidin domain-containing protein [Streptomyces sp. NBC_00047]MCX5609678.1 discoidin domain-containing protein [Streptomyces sp. NBC_00047]
MPSRMRSLVTAALLAGAVTVLPTAPAHAAGSVVKVTGSQGNWRLTVDGSPYLVKGVTWGPSPSDASRLLPDVRSLGANTIRTWGTDASSRQLFDAAASNGVKVVAGFWLQPGGGPGSGGCTNYVTDTTYKNTVLAEFSRWVEAYRDHPAVLMWNVGNESVLGLQNCYGGTELENQRNAYTTFVNDVAKAIHRIDADHPVTSTDAWAGAWTYYKRNSPDLDLYSVNSYKEVCGVKQAWEQGGYTKPYLITETGPAGEWEVPDDANGVPLEPGDQAKADGYTHAWNCVTGHSGVALGATVFHYGTEYDFGGHWFNLTPAGERRTAYYAVKRAYGGNTAGDNLPPTVQVPAVADPAAVPAGKEVTIQAPATDPEGDPLSYEVLWSGRYADGGGGGGGLVSVPSTHLGGGTLTAAAPARTGVWKLYVKVKDGRGNVGVEQRSVKVVPPPVAGTDVARGRPTTASTFQNDGWGGCPCTPRLATDGVGDTRWASGWADAQWLQVDLGSVRQLRHAQLVWEPAYGKAYSLQVSDDGRNWRTAYATSSGDGGVDDFDVSASGRYVRLDLTQRGTGYGYSLFHFGAYA